MSYDDYQDSKRLGATGATFTSLIMAAIRVAAPRDWLKLVATWPDVYQEYWEHTRAALRAPKGSGGPPEVAVRSSNP